MSAPLEPPLAPRRGATLDVLIVCRISTEHQDLRSLADQEALLRRWLQDHYNGPTDVKVISGCGSGEHLDRDDLIETEALIEGGAVDLVLVEDLGRICRRARAFQICEMTQDAGVRLIALNDHVDTAREDWNINALLGVFRHESYNRDTGKRIRRSLRNRFSQGGVVQSLVYGYVKPPGARTDAEVSKDPEAEPVYDGWFHMLEQGATFAEVADWLNTLGVRPGPACRAGTWDTARVRGVTLNPILKGVRVRNRKMTRRVNKTGRPRAVDAPPGERLERHVPHLAFIEPERYDRVVALLARRNAKYRRTGDEGGDPRANVPRKRTPFPGQHLTCGVCGRLYYFGGHGRAGHLMCSGSRLYTCWNGIAVDGALAAAKIAEAALTAAADLPEFDDAFVRLVREEAEALAAGDARRVEECRRREGEAAAKIVNLAAALAELGSSPALLEALRALEGERDRLAAERRDLERAAPAAVALPPAAELLRRAAEAFEGLARRAPEAGRLARRLIPRLEVRPYRLCDGGAPVPRAHMVLDLAPLAPEAGLPEGRAAALRRELTVDLFDPPQRVAYRERVVALRAGGLTERQVAAALGLTVTAAQRAAALDRLMRERGLTDPYEPLTGPPPDQARMRRHRHPRYRFDPLPGTPDRDAG